MTYCVGMRLNKGLVFMSDTRTNAGVDDISQVRKMRSWHVPGERVITLMSAGNLATTQAVVSLLDERTKAPEERHPSILDAPSMFAVATIVGETLRSIVMRHNDEGPAAVVVETDAGTSVLGGDVGYSYRELGSGATEGQRRVLALGAPTWLSHAQGPKIPEHRP